MSDLINEKGQINVTELLAEEVERFVVENKEIILKRAMERLKTLKKERDGATLS